MYLIGKAHVVKSFRRTRTNNGTSDFATRFFSNHTIQYFVVHFTILHWKLQLPSKFDFACFWEGEKCCWALQRSDTRVFHYDDITGVTCTREHVREREINPRAADEGRERKRSRDAETLLYRSPAKRHKSICLRHGIYRGQLHVASNKDGSGWTSRWRRCSVHLKGLLVNGRYARRIRHRKIIISAPVVCRRPTRLEVEWIELCRKTRANRETVIGWKRDNWRNCPQTR